MVKEPAYLPLHELSCPRWECGGKGGGGHVTPDPAKQCDWREWETQMASANELWPEAAERWESREAVWGVGQTRAGGGNLRQLMGACVCVHQSVDYQLYMESQRTGPRERERDIKRGKKSEKCVCAYVLILKDTLSALGALLSPAAIA